MAQASQRDDRRRFEERWPGGGGGGGGDRRFHGRDDQAERTFTNQYRPGLRNFSGSRFSGLRQTVGAGPKRRW